LSVRVLTDRSGNVVGRQAHLPFGEDFAESNTQEKHHLTSYERDSEDGTDYAMNRQCLANIGRFMQPDRMNGRLNDPQTLNKYAYSRNDSINLIDPTGLWCFGYFVTYLTINVDTSEIVNVENGGFLPVRCSGDTFGLNFAIGTGTGASTGQMDKAN